MEPRIILLILIVVAVLLVGLVFIRRRGRGRGPTPKGSPAVFGQDNEPTTSIPRSTQRLRTGLIDRAGGQLSGRFQTITQRRTTRSNRPGGASRLVRSRLNKLGTGLYSNVNRRSKRGQRSRVMTVTDERLLIDESFDDYDDAPVYRPSSYDESGFDLPQNLNEFGAVVSPTITASRAYTSGTRYGKLTFETTGGREFVERGTDLNPNYSPLSTFDYLKFADKPPAIAPDFDLEYPDHPYTSFFTGVRGSGLSFMGHIYERTNGGREFTVNGNGNGNGHGPNGNGNGNGIHVVGFPGLEGLDEIISGSPSSGSGLNNYFEEVPPQPETPTPTAERLVAEPLFAYTASGITGLFSGSKEERRKVRGNITRHPFAPFSGMWQRRNRVQLVIVGLASVFIIFGIISGLVYLGRAIDRVPSDKFSVVLGRIGLDQNFADFEQGRLLTQSFQDDLLKSSGIVTPEIRRSDVVISSLEQAVNEQNRTRADVAIWGYFDESSQLIQLRLRLNSNGPFDINQSNRREMEHYFYEPVLVQVALPSPQPGATNPDIFARLMAAFAGYYDGNYDNATANFTNISRDLGKNDRPELHIFNGNTLYLLGQYDAAVREYGTATRLTKELTDQQIVSGVDANQIANNQAIVYAAQGKFNEANAILNALYTNNSNEVRFVTNYAAFQLERGGAANTPALLAEFADKLRPVTDANPTYWPAAYYSGQVNRLLGYWTPAESYFLKAQQLRPDFASTYNGLGMTYLDKFFALFSGRGANAEGDKLLSDARAQFQKGQDLANSQREGFVNRANVLRQTLGKEILAPGLENFARTSLQEVNDGKYGLARDVLERGRLEGNKIGNFLDQFMRWMGGQKTALEDSRDRFVQITEERKDFADGYFFLGETYYLLGDQANANKNYDQAKSRQTRLLYYSTIAEHLAAENKKKEVLDQVNEYIKRNPNASNGYVALAQLNLRLNDPQNALAAADNAITRNAKDAGAYLVAARALSQLGRFPEAAARFSDAARLDASNSDIPYERGLALYRSGNTNDAVVSLQQALNMKPGGYPNAHYITGLIYLNTYETIQQGVAELEKAVAEQDNFTEVWLKLGQIYSQQNRLTDSRHAYEKVLQYDPNNYMAAYSLGLILETQGLLPEAATRYRQAIQLKPGLLNAYLNLAKLQARSSDPSARDEAVSLARAAVQLDPRFVESHYVLGFALSQRNQFPEAVKAFSDAINLKKDYAQAYFGRAGAEKNLNQFEAALADIAQAIKVSPTEPTYYLLQGQIYQAKGDGEKALPAYGAALDNKLPDPAMAYLGIGDIYLSRGQSNVAETNYLKALSINPQLTQATFQLASVYFLQNRVDKATAEFEKAAKNLDNQSLAYYYLGSLYTRQGRIDDALKAYENAVKLDPSRVEARFELGNTYRVKGLRSEAIKQYDEAIKLNKAYSPAYLQKGLTYEETGQLAEARVALIEAQKSQDANIRQQANDALLRIGRQ